MIGLAVKHPILTLIGVWIINGAVRNVIANATGYNLTAITLDALKARNKAADARDKLRNQV